MSASQGDAFDGKKGEMGADIGELRGDEEELELDASPPPSMSCLGTDWSPSRLKEPFMLPRGLGRVRRSIS